MSKGWVSRVICFEFWLHRRETHWERSYLLNILLKLIQPPHSYTDYLNFTPTLSPPTEPDTKPPPKPKLSSTSLDPHRLPSFMRNEYRKGLRSERNGQTEAVAATVKRIKENPLAKLVYDIAAVPQELVEYMKMYKMPKTVAGTQSYERWLSRATAVYFDRVKHNEVGYEQAVVDMFDMMKLEKFMLSEDLVEEDQPMVYELGTKKRSMSE